MLTCWHSDNEGLGVWPLASPVCGPDFEQIALPRLQTVHQGRSSVSREGEGLCSERFESGGIWKNVFWNDLADGWKEENEHSPVSGRQTVWAEGIRTHIAEAHTLVMHTWPTAAAEEWGARPAHTHLSPRKLQAGSLLFFSTWSTQGGGSYLYTTDQIYMLVWGVPLIYRVSIVALHTPMQETKGPQKWWLPGTGSE